MSAARNSMKVSRRGLLRGVGVCLALPWLETLAPRAKAQAAAPRRFVAAYFPNGTAATYWPPTGVGSGSAWGLSPILAPFAKLKSQLTVLSNLENYSSMQDNEQVEPSHARLCGAFLTCVDSDRIRNDLKTEPANGVSVDQIVAARMNTQLRSLEVGLSTLNSYEDGRHPALSRSIAWKTATQPLYKEVNPQAVFDRLVASGASGAGSMDPAAQREADRRKTLKLSVLDFALESATALNTKLGREDKPRLDQFLTSVRELEQRVSKVSATMTTGDSMCVPLARPTEVYAVNKTDGYNRGTHATLMTDLIVMALRCDMTRVVTHMLDDARSDFVYDHLTTRKFTAGGSTPGTGAVSGYHGLQHAGDSNDGFATINWWLSSVTADLCQKLADIDEGDGSLLDHTLVMYAGAMHGSNHDAFPLPVALLGGGKAGMKTDQHIKFSAPRPLRDLYFTILNSYFQLGVASFGDSLMGAKNQTIAELLV
jgi:hypothetical protein